MRPSSQLALLVLFGDLFIFTIACVFNHQAISAILLRTNLLFFAWEVDAVVILDISYLLFAVSVFLPICVMVLKNYFK